MCVRMRSRVLDSSCVRMRECVFECKNVCSNARSCVRMRGRVLECEVVC